MRQMQKTKLNNFLLSSEKWKRKSLTIAIMVILFCFLIGNDHYNAYALVRKNRAILPDKKIVNYRYIPKPTSSLLFSSALAGGDNCANATNVTMSTFNDTGNTTGSNNTISNYNRPALQFPYSGPDQYYKIVLTVAGSIGASMDLTGSTLDGALFLTNVCPAGTGNTIAAANSLGNSQDAIGPGAGPEVLPVTTLPAGTYYIGVDSYYASGTAGSAGPYSITINSVGLAPTAAPASVSGRVINAQGRGIARARIVITDSTGQTHFVTTNPFGFYRIDSLNAGEIYIFQVVGKQYQFANPIQTVSVNQDLTDVNFTAIP